MWDELSGFGRFPLLVASMLAGCAEETMPEEGARGALDWCIGRADHKPIKLTGGARTMMALFDDGTVYCWGDNYTSQCDGTTYLLLFQAPIQVANLPCLTNVAVSSAALGVLSDGRAVSWAGVPAPTPGAPGRATEARLIGLDSVSFVHSNGSFLAAIASGQVHWWGLSFPDHAKTPTKLSLGVDAEGLGGSEGASCYVLADGSLACRGRNQNGLLGPGQEDSGIPRPIDIGGPAMDAFVDGTSACAVRADGEVACWGSNWFGALGRGMSGEDLESDAHPELILAAGPFSSVTGHTGGVCAWRPSGEVYCWGDAGAVPYPSEEAFSRPPRRVPHLEPARQIAMIDERVCALGFDDKVRCHVNELDPDVPPSAEVLEFPPPLSLQEQLDAASR